MKISVVLLLAVLVLAACGGGVQPGAADPSPQPPPSEEPLPRPAIVIDQADLIVALEGQGASVEVGETLTQAFFGPVATILRVNGADVQVFEYPDEAAMESDAALVEPDGGSIGTTMAMWVDDPHFYKTGRIIVLYIGSDPAIIDLLENVVGPQFAGR